MTNAPKLGYGSPTRVTPNANGDAMNCSKTFLLGLSLLLIPACGGDKDDTASAGDDTATGDSGDTQDPVSEDAPVVVSADAYCELHDVGDKYYQWTLQATVTDPQGLDTVVRYDSTQKSNYTQVLSSAGGELARYGLTCADGECFGSFKESEDGIACSNASSYTFRFVVSDEDGNKSANHDIEGRQG